MLYNHSIGIAMEQAWHDSCMNSMTEKQSGSHFHPVSENPNTRSAFMAMDSCKVCCKSSVMGPKRPFHAMSP